VPDFVLEPWSSWPTREEYDKRYKDLKTHGKNEKMHMEFFMLEFCYILWFINLGTYKPGY